MQSILNLNLHYGLPLCVSGITHRLSLSKEMADHERRRKAMKRQRSQAREEGFHQEMGIQRLLIHEEEEEEEEEEEIKLEEGDLVNDDGVAPNDFSHNCFPCTAKAA